MALFGATVGAGIAYGWSVAANISNNGMSVDAFTSDVDWGSVGTAAVVGGVAGLTGGMGAAYLGTGLGATAVSGVLAGQAAVATSNVMEGKTWNEGMGNPKQMAADAVLAVGFSAIGEAFAGEPCSFSAETEVLTEDGLKPISSVKPGEFVWAWDEANQRTALYPVVAQFAHLDPAIVTLVVNGETIYTTPEHPFYVVGKGWTEAGTLQLGEWIARADGTSGVVQQINIVQRSQLMYDLTVTQAHTFFVGQQQWLVHNCGGTPRGKQAGPTVDRLTGEEVQRFVVDPRGNTMIEPQGGKTIATGPSGVDTHTLYPNGSNYQRLNPVGHANNPVPHGHGHQLGVGPNMRGQGNSLDVNGNVVPWASQAAHWQIK